MRYIVQVIQKMESNIPADSSINTWAFASASPTPDTVEMGAIATGLFDFYNELYSLMAVNLASYWGLKVYNWYDPEPRSPLIDADDFGPFSFPNLTPLPSEVALCLSFRGPYESGEPKARRRGRIYVGPLAATTSTSAPNGARPASGVPAFFSDAVEALQAAITPEGVVHCVWSRADETFYPVVEYWVDNAFDTQRRRGIAPTERTVLPIP